MLDTSCNICNVSVGRVVSNYVGQYFSKFFLSTQTFESPCVSPFYTKGLKSSTNMRIESLNDVVLRVCYDKLTCN